MTGRYSMCAQLHTSLTTRALHRPPHSFFPLQILCSTCDALVHLHSQTPPVAHRDIKVNPAAAPCSFGSTTPPLPPPHSQASASSLSSHRLCFPSNRWRTCCKAATASGRYVTWAAASHARARMRTRAKFRGKRCVQLPCMPSLRVF